MMNLANLGWRPFFQTQLTAGRDDALRPARVMAMHRGRIEIAGEQVPDELPLSGKAADLGVTVGDWVLVDPDGPRLEGPVGAVVNPRSRSHDRSYNISCQYPTSTHRSCL